jgi:hypothetical protein
LPIDASYDEESAVSAEVKPFVGECSDADLCTAIGAGDQEAFRTLMLPYNKRLYRTARSIRKDEPDAEDTLQNAYTAPLFCCGPVMIVQSRKPRRRSEFQKQRSGLGFLGRERCSAAHSRLMWTVPVTLLAFYQNPGKLYWEN